MRSKAQLEQDIAKKFEDLAAAGIAEITFSREKFLTNPANSHSIQVTLGPGEERVKITQTNPDKTLEFTSGIQGFLDRAGKVIVCKEKFDTDLDLAVTGTGLSKGELLKNINGVEVTRGPVLMSEINLDEPYKKISEVRGEVEKVIEEKARTINSLVGISDGADVDGLNGSNQERITDLTAAYTDKLTAKISPLDKGVREDYLQKQGVPSNITNAAFANHQIHSGVKITDIDHQIDSVKRDRVNLVKEFFEPVNQGNEITQDASNSLFRILNQNDKAADVFYEELANSTYKDASSDNLSSLLERQLAIQKHRIMKLDNAFSMYSDLADGLPEIIKSSHNTELGELGYIANNNAHNESLSDFVASIRRDYVLNPNLPGWRESFDNPIISKSSEIVENATQKLSEKQQQEAAVDRAFNKLKSANVESIKMGVGGSFDLLGASLTSRGPNRVTVTENATTHTKQRDGFVLEATKVASAIEEFNKFLTKHKKGLSPQELFEGDQEYRTFPNDKYKEFFTIDHNDKLAFQNIDLDNPSRFLSDLDLAKQDVLLQASSVGARKDIEGYLVTKYPEMVGADGGLSDFSGAVRKFWPTTEMVDKELQKLEKSRSEFIKKTIDKSSSDLRESLYDFLEESLSPSERRDIPKKRGEIEPPDLLKQFSLKEIKAAYKELAIEFGETKSANSREAEVKSPLRSRDIETNSVSKSATAEEVDSIDSQKIEDKTPKKGSAVNFYSVTGAIMVIGSVAGLFMGISAAAMGCFIAIGAVLVGTGVSTAKTPDRATSNNSTNKESHDQSVSQMVSTERGISNRDQEAARELGSSLNNSNVSVNSNDNTRNIARLSGERAVEQRRGVTRD